MIKMTIVANIVFFIALVMGILLTVVDNDFFFLKIGVILLFIVSGIIHIVDRKKK